MWWPSVEPTWLEAAATPSGDGRARHVFAAPARARRCPSTCARQQQQRAVEAASCNAEARLAVSTKDAAVRLAVGGSCGARARGIMLSNTGTHTCVAAASPRLPKPKNVLRALVVG